MKTINIRIFYWQQMSNTATNTVTPLGAPFLRTTHMSNSQKVAIFFIPVLIDYLQIYVIDVHS